MIHHSIHLTNTNISLASTPLLCSVNLCFSRRHIPVSLRLHRRHHFKPPSPPSCYQNLVSFLLILYLLDVWYSLVLHFLTYTIAMILCKTGFHKFRRHLSTIARTSSVFYLQLPTNLANKINLCILLQLPSIFCILTSLSLIIKSISL